MDYIPPMKTLLLALLLTIGHTHAGQISFIGPCSEEPLLTSSFIADDNANVGALTVDILILEGVPFQGTDQGINSIFKTPTGIYAMEILSNSDMNAHGWCYSINGEAPEVYPHEIPVKTGDEITWWFGFAAYRSGEWITQCEPTHLRAPAQFCR